MTAHLLQMSGVIIDLLYRVETVPKPGEEAVVNDFDMKLGGGFNAMVAAKRAGMDVSYGGAIGTGPFALMALEAIEAEGIAVLRPRDTSRDQGCCTVIIDKQGERSFLASEGAEGHATTAELESMKTQHFDWALLSGYALYYQGSRAAICDWVQSHSSTSRLIFDPSPVIASIPEDVRSIACTNAMWISTNSHEACILTGEADPAKAAQELALNRPENGGAIVREGEHGCIVAMHDSWQRIPTYQVAAIDTNGAGDTHLGSFIARLAHGDSPIDAASYANIAAALSTTKHGPATAPQLEEVIAIQENARTTI